MERLTSSRSKVGLLFSADLGLLSRFLDEPRTKYLFDVITKEGERKHIKGISLDPQGLGVHVSVYDLKRPLFSQEKVIESKNPLFQVYLSRLKKEHGTDPNYKEALEMLEDATAIIVTATYEKRILGAPPYTDIHFATREIRALRRGEIIG